MTKAIWNEEVIAESDKVVLVENRVYFPPDSLVAGTLQESETSGTYCHWKGDATYFDVHSKGQVNPGAAWIYAEPYEAAGSIAGFVAFWKGIDVEDKPEGSPLQDPRGPLGKRTGYRALCWLLERSSDAELSAAHVEELIGLPASELPETFAHHCVQPFARHLGWRLEGGGLRKG